MSEELTKILVGAPIAIIVSLLLGFALYLLFLQMRSKMGLDKASAEDPRLVRMEAAIVANGVALKTLDDLVRDLFDPRGKPGLASMVERMVQSLDRNSETTHEQIDSQAKLLGVMSETLLELKKVSEGQESFVHAASSLIAQRR